MTLRLGAFSGLLVFSLLFRLLISTSIYSGDVNNHISWGKSNLQFGFSGAYDRKYTGVMQPTYPPLALYAFTTSTGLYTLTTKLSLFLNQKISLFPSKIIWFLENQNVLPAFNKVIAIVSDLGIGLLVYRFVRKYFPGRPKLAFIISAAYLLNPAVWFNSSLWGQIESFPLFFLLLAIWLLTNHKPILGHAAFICALLAKQSSIIFAPLFFIISWKLMGPKNTLKGLLLQLLIFYASFIPFFGSFNPFWPFQVYLNRLQTGGGSNYITDHAFNAWIWFSHLAKIPDTIHFLGPFSAQIVGFAVFGLSAGLVILEFTRRKLTFTPVFLSSALMPMLSFLVLTKMHERYFAPALPFLVLAAAKRPWVWLIYVTVSLAHLINMYHLWWFPPIPDLISLISQWSTIEYVAGAFTICTAVVYLTYFLPVHENKL